MSKPKYVAITTEDFCNAIRDFAVLADRSWAMNAKYVAWMELVDGERRFRLAKRLDREQERLNALFDKMQGATVH